MSQDFRKKYQEASKTLVADILDRDSPATRDELEILFQRHLIGKPLPDFIMAFFPDAHLAKMVVLALYRVNVILKDKEQYRVCQQLIRLTGYHNKTVYKWIKAEFYNNKPVKSK